MRTLSTDCVTETSALHDLAGEWAELWPRVPDATPFGNPSWLLAWWRHFGTGRPLVGTLRGGDGRLLAVLPAYVLEEEGKILPIGAGISDVLDALIAPEAPQDAASRLLEAVLSAAGDVRVCHLIELPPDSPLRHAPPPRGWRADLHDGAVCPVLTLLAGDTTLRRSLPPGAHRKLRMNRHRATRAGGMDVRFATADTLDEHLQAVFRLHDERWTSRGEPGGVLADRRVRDVLADACPALLNHGALLAATLRVGGEVASACLALTAGPDRVLMYLGGFAGAFAFCSPGSLLLGALAERAVAEGRRELHFLRGAEAYKYAWGATDQRNAIRCLTCGS